MIKVSEETCEAMLSQFRVSPAMRAGVLADRMIEENPEVVMLIGKIFQEYINTNRKAGAQLDETAIAILYANAVLFACVGWGLVQSQADSNEMLENTGEMSF